MNALDNLLGQLGPDTIARMAGQLGVSPQQTQTAIQAALPMLMGAMQRNAATPQGAESLHQAVTRDHQGVDLGGLLGGLLGGGGGGGAGALGGLLGGGGNAGGGLGGLMGAVMGAMSGGQPQGAQRSPLENGAAILGHVFGQQQPRAAAGVARASGLDGATAAKLMAMLAPLLMGALGQATQKQGLDAGGLGDLLGQVTRGLGGQGGQGGQGSGVPNVVSSMLDSDGDGDVDAQDLLAAGSKLFGSFMQR